MTTVTGFTVTEPSCLTNTNRIDNLGIKSTVPAIHGTVTGDTIVTPALSQKKVPVSRDISSLLSIK